MSLQPRIRERLLIYHRVEPDALRALLPEGLEPSLQRGYALVGICHTRLESTPSRWFPRWSSTADQLAYHTLVEGHTRLERQAEGAPRLNGSTLVGARPGIWVLRRETSSWLRARSLRSERAECGLARFEVERDTWHTRLRVRAGSVEELYVNAEPCDRLRGSVFASTIEAEEFLARRALLHDLAGPPSPESDELGLDRGRWRLEPLSLVELRSSFLEDTRRFPCDAIQLDSAFRLSRTPLAPVRPEAAVRRSEAVSMGAEAAPCLSTDVTGEPWLPL